MTAPGEDRAVAKENARWWRRAPMREDLHLLALMLSIKALLLVFVAISYYAFANQRFHGALGWLGIWNRWDALHYLRIAEHGYSGAGPDKLLLVFYPLYPWTVRFAALFGGNYLFSAFVVSTIASLAAGLLLYRLAGLDAPVAEARRAVWFLFIFPTSFFLHIGYTESLFLALMFGCLLAARQEFWAIAGVLGALASMTRVSGVLLLAPLIVEAALTFRRTRRWRWQWLWMFVVPCGFGVYLWLNARLTGDPFAFMSVQYEHWRKTLSSPFHGIMEAARNMRRTPSDAVMVGLHELLFAMFGAVCTVICFWKQRLSYAVWMLLNWALFAGTSFVQSVPRYTLVLFPIFLLFARTSEDRLPGRLITAWSLLFLGTFAVKFAQGQWAF
jgi:Gpi18-like mannosyltransferase